MMLSRGTIRDIQLIHFSRELPLLLFRIQSSSPQEKECLSDSKHAIDCLKVSLICISSEHCFISHQPPAITSTLVCT
ncbi:hypothetical protein CEP54_004152 [Fusarium duplospermum]|uniref:Uncharacterized protein n=1 Tax=Fusarium duplospermum TaxID=1325734 RepID=A0A428QK27_9HYPO|nr:hypothetical protein CEP54_004152 [Fusarium duplospermum]